MGLGNGKGAEAEMDLLQVLFHQFPLSARGWPAALSRRPAGRDPVEQAVQQGQEFSVVDPPGGGNDDILGPVGVIPVADDEVAGKGAHARLCADDRHAEGVSLPEILGKQVVNQVVGGVFEEADLLENDFPLLFDLLRVEQGVEKDVGEERHRLREELVEDLGVIADVLAAGECVEDPAEGVDLPGDLQGAPLRGSLEEEMLDEMGDTVELNPLVPGAAGNPDADGYRVGMGNIFGDDANAVVENRFFDHVNTIPGYA